jgi:hypothetical protein
VITNGEPAQPLPLLEVSLKVTATPPQLSLVVMLPTPPGGMSATQFTVTSAGQLMVGASLSETLMVKLQEAVLLLSSVAVKVMVCEPRPKHVPLALPPVWVTETLPQSSVAVAAAKFTVAQHAPGSVPAPTLPWQAMVGGVTSRASTMSKDPLNAQPFASAPAKVWVPTANPVKVLFVPIGPPSTLYVYGAVPPEAVIVTVPLLWLQVAVVVAVVAEMELPVALITTLALATQELPSTTSTLYVPGAKPEMDWLKEVYPDGPDHENENGAVPLVKVTVAVPLFTPQAASVPVAVAVMLHGKGTVMLKLPTPEPGDGQELSTALIDTV